MHPALDPLRFVRESTAALSAACQVIAIDAGATARLADALEANRRPPGWDASVHFVGAPSDTVQYLLVLDALNFCFWPDPGLGYADLATGLREALLADPRALDATALAAVTPETIARWFGRRPCLADERARLVREVGAGLGTWFDGRAERLVAAAECSAARLVWLLTAHFPGFRDVSIVDGHQVALLKRAQIFAADVWGALGGTGLGAFDDIASLTTFADYRVPQLLRHTGMLRFAPALAAAIDRRAELPAGCLEEVAIRAATVQAVEALRAVMANRGRLLTAVEVDWWLWHVAESRAEELVPHHRTLTTNY